MAKMERKRTLTMNWDNVGDDDDDAFFDTYNRGSTASPDDLGDDSDDDNFEDSRMSFSSSASFRPNDFRNSIRRGDDFRSGINYRPPSIKRDDFSIKFRSSIRHDDFHSYNVNNGLSPNYDVWMSAPGSIQERRKKLFAGMGLDSNKELLKDSSIMFSRKITRKLSNFPMLPPTSAAAPSPAGAPPRAPKPSKAEARASPLPPPSSTPVPPPSEDSSHQEPEESESDSQSQPHTPPSHGPIELVRSRSDGDIDFETQDIVKRRKEDLLGVASKQRLTRTYSEIVMSHARIIPYSEALRIVAAPHMTSPTKRKNGHKASLSSVVSNSRFGAFFLIKDLDTGKEFIVNEFDQNGMWNKFSDLETGKKLTAEEFEKRVGFSPVVKELMRRENKSHEHNMRKFASNSYISKSIKLSKQRGAALLKNLSVNFKGSMKIGDKESPHLAPASPAPGDPKGNKNTSSWIKVKQNGKTHKDLSALHLCQEIQAHEGSIWTMKFNFDGRFLASAGEDKTIHVWEVQECEIMSSRLPEDWNSTPLHHSASHSPAHPNLGEAQQMPSEKKKKGKAAPANKKGSSVPDYARVPETVFALSEKPICSFTGHAEDILDLSWSKTQLLLSSSMDKTVKLWDMESKSCVKTFIHSDYVTCIDFSPIDDNIFISGSLDEKVRMWNIRTRRLVAYFDVYEMITAICYSPDGKEALVGTHKGNCRVFAAEDCKLEETLVIETQKKKPQIKKITGFQFAPGNPSEVLITSADSRIRIFEGEDVVHKFIGFKNTSSQIAASFSNDAKYVISASEDSQVYVWRREEPRNTGAGKAKTRIITNTYEHFSGKDISVAITWPGSPKNEPPAPVAERPHKKHSRRRSNLPPAVTEDNAPAPAKKTKPPRPKKGGTTPAAASSSADKDKETSETSREEEGSDAQASGSDSGVGESPGHSRHHSESAPKNASWAPSWAPSWMDSSDKDKDKDKDRVTAWGLVIVTAGLGGEIRAYQNFGLPRRIGGLPTTLF